MRAPLATRAWCAHTCGVCVEGGGGGGLPRTCDDRVGVWRLWPPIPPRPSGRALAPSQPQRMPREAGPYSCRCPPRVGAACTAQTRAMSRARCSLLVCACQIAVSTCTTCGVHKGYMKAKGIVCQILGTAIVPLMPTTGLARADTGGKCVLVKGDREFVPILRLRRVHLRCLPNHVHRVDDVCLLLHGRFRNRKAHCPITSAHRRIAQQQKMLIDHGKSA